MFQGCIRKEAKQSFKVMSHRFKSGDQDKKKKKNRGLRQLHDIKGEYEDQTTF